MITKYKESHGITITLGDTSHPNAVEVDWIRSTFMEEWEVASSQNSLKINNILETRGKLIDAVSTLSENIVTLTNTLNSLITSKDSSQVSKSDNSKGLVI